MIIDAHTHIFNDEMVHNKEKYCDDRQFSLLYYGKAKIANAEMLLESMNNNAVDASVTLGFTWQKKEYAIEHNEYLVKMQQKYKGKVYAFGAIALESDIYEQITLIKEMGLYGIGEVAFYVSGFNEEEELLCGQILAIAEKVKLPVCLHVNEPVGHFYAGKYYTDMRKLFALLAQYSKIPIICSHWGGGLLFYELMPEVKQSLRHVYYDTAATPFLYHPDIYSISIQVCGKEKIIFGSDYPLLGYSRYAQHFENLGNSADHILYKNVIQLLGIQ
ncbi:MAG: amidohydrolase family protein [Spirochaetes bacterium]|nr:amidohydrolase family protein [Spirochaetota bacterium]